MATIHIVEQGEYLSSIAKQYRFANYRTIYDHPQNAEFKRKRPNPNVIFPGDELFIPDKEERYESRSTEQRHRFRLKRPKLLLRIIVKDDEGRPFANAAYTLRVEDQIYKGTTNGKGLVQQEIPIGAVSGDLTLERSRLTWPLQIGHLDPVDEVIVNKAIITGMQARLNNLGFICGPVDGILGPKTNAAIKAFQKDVLKRADPDGEPDKATRDRLLSEHGC